ncbi:hypothetical protein [Carnobacterium sp. FSL W8-0810]|uniref:hypothetical protein n=1 Tax=Carnobacterium sp. FSL W8-0810 TaxID=2954705 RepID=UPI0030F5C8B9
MNNNRLPVLGAIILDIALILYLIVFLHDLTIDMLTIKEMIIILLIAIFTLYANINTFGKHSGASIILCK